jgi:hypothetical protein
VTGSLARLFTGPLTVGAKGPSVAGWGRAVVGFAVVVDHHLVTVDHLAVLLPPSDERLRQCRDRPFATFGRHGAAPPAAGSLVQARADAVCYLPDQVQMCRRRRPDPGSYPARRAPLLIGDDTVIPASLSRSTSGVCRLPAPPLPGHAGFVAPAARGVSVLAVPVSAHLAVTLTSRHHPGP